MAGTVDESPSVASRAGRRTRAMALPVVAVAGLCGVWEGYKALGEAVDGAVLGWELPANYDDVSMPHISDIVARFSEPTNRGTTESVGRAVVKGAWYTLQLATVGLAVGIVVGLLLAMLMQRFRVTERGLLPYVILSQTVPFAALAPLVSGWSGQLSILGYEWERWMSVSFIASYLAFFPIAVGALRGLQSPTPATIELMDSYAASGRATLLKLRFPSAVPYLIPALRLAFASAIVGSIVAEISVGHRGGVGRLILEYSQQALTDPPKVYTAMLGAALLGLVAAALVNAFEAWVLRHRPREALR
jgi:NitT/TauT family transport system permease protein